MKMHHLFAKGNKFVNNLIILVRLIAPSCYHFVILQKALDLKKYKMSSQIRIKYVETKNYIINIKNTNINILSSTILNTKKQTAKGNSRSPKTSICEFQTFLG